MMSHVLLFVCDFIVRTLEPGRLARNRSVSAAPAYPVGAVMIGVVTTTKLISIVGDVGIQGHGIVSDQRVLPICRIPIPIIIGRIIGEHILDD